MQVIVRTPYRTPQANGPAERWVGSTRRECLDWLLIVNRDHLERARDEYADHHNPARPRCSRISSRHAEPVTRDCTTSRTKANRSYGSRPPPRLVKAKPNGFNRTRQGGEWARIIFVRCGGYRAKFR